MRTVFGSSTWDTVHSQCSHCSSNSEAETILNRGNVMVHTDTKQRQKGITGYFTFLYNTFQNHDLMPAWKAKWRPWDKAGSFVYTRFGLTFRSVSVLAPIFRKYPLSRWWICLVSDPSPKLHSVPVWMDELNPGLGSFQQVTGILHSSTFVVSHRTWPCVLYQLNTLDRPCYVMSCAALPVLLGYWACFVREDRWSVEWKFFFKFTVGV